jgi:hypothetical protein
MASKLKSDTARANGAKSRGPKSAATREKSSRNSLRHGLTSRHILVLECESEGEFQQLENETKAAYQPADGAQRALVHEMIAARWRLDRIRSIETNLISFETARRKHEVDRQYLDLDPAIHMALAVKALADESSVLALISRYESRLSRMHDRALRSLRELQSVPAEKLPPAPAPEATPPHEAPPSEPKIKNDETNPSPVVEPKEKLCAHALPAEKRESRWGGRFRLPGGTRSRSPFQSRRSAFQSRARKQAVLWARAFRKLSRKLAPGGVRTRAQATKPAQHTENMTNKTNFSARTSARTRPDSRGSVRIS